MLEKRPWKPIERVPFNREVCLWIKDSFGPYRLPFPCRKEKRGWLDARQGVLLHVAPLGWSEWDQRFLPKKW